MNPLAASGVSLLRDAVAARSGKPVEIRYELAATGYVLHLEIGNGGVARQFRIACPHASSMSPGRRLHGVTLSGPSPETIPVPGEFLRGSVDRLFTAAATEVTSHIDLVALFDWATGSSVSSSRSTRTNWSYLALDTNMGWTASYAFTDSVVDELLLAIDGPDPTGRGLIREPWFLVTGDTDDASESQILEYLEFMGEREVPVVLLFRSGEQLTPRVVRAMGNYHQAGIHPYAHGGDTGEFLDDLARLADATADATGQAPLACRHHRFQWHDPKVVRQALLERGVRAELNLVAASGRSWIGTPTGIGWPLSVRVSSRSRPPLWIIPTVLEDDVFLFDEEYCYTHSHDVHRDMPRHFLREFLNYWYLFRGLPICVNLHPEHVVDPLRWVMDTVVEWITDYSATARSLSAVLVDLDGSVAE